MGAVAHHIFLLVPTGRGRQLVEEAISAREYEDVLSWFYHRRDSVPIQLKATCAPHYHRILRQKARAEGKTVDFKTFGLDAVSRGCLGAVRASSLSPIRDRFNPAVTSNWTAARCAARISVTSIEPHPYFWTSGIGNAIRGNAASANTGMSAGAAGPEPMRPLAIIWLKNLCAFINPSGKNKDRGHLERKKSTERGRTNRTR